MNNKRSQIIPYSDFLEKNKKPKVSACSWKWNDIYPKLKETNEVSLVNKDLESSGGVSPNLNALVQVLKPGTEGESHRHSNVALFFVFKGQGYSMIDGEKFEWEKGDLVFAPAWSDHGHSNTSETEEAILITIQDVPLVSNMGVYFIEEPLGDPPRHILEKSDN